MNDRIKEISSEDLSSFISRCSLTGKALVLYSRLGGSSPPIGSTLIETYVKKTEILVEFTRTSPVVETGRGTILVSDPDDVEEIQEKMARGEFKSFVITSRRHLDLEWDWESKELGNDDNAA